MATKPQDVVVVLKLALSATRPSYGHLADELGMSASEVHAAVRRLEEARLLEVGTQTVRHETLQAFLVHGVPHVFPAKLGEVTRGMPTAWAVPVFAAVVQVGGQLPPVWPDPEGRVQGSALQPLYPSVPQAARRDPALYELLALVDTVRLGRARERALAVQLLAERLNRHVAS